jgi:molybdopterin-guanine dinucleotide biosynthesis protein A
VVAAEKTQAFSALVLAGGAARRMGGAPKPLLTVGGTRMLDRVLVATAAAAPRIVVGPLELAASLPRGVSLTVENPPGSGPVAAIGAGLALLAQRRPRLVAVVAGDLPFLTRAAVSELRRAADQREVDGAVLVDDSGHPQWLAGVWRFDALVSAMPATPAEPRARRGVGVRQVVDGLRIAGLTRATPGDDPPFWFDCDTEADVRRAEGWADAG